MHRGQIGRRGQKGGGGLGSGKAENGGRRKEEDCSHENKSVIHLGDAHWITHALGKWTESDRGAKGRPRGPDGATHPGVIPSGPPSPCSPNGLFHSWRSTPPIINSRVPRRRERPDAPYSKVPGSVHFAGTRS